MKQRNVIAVVIFSLITLGIYDLFWLASTKKELNQRVQTKVPSLWLLFSPILAIAFVAVVQLLAHAASSGSSNAIVSILSLLIGFLGVIGIVTVPFYWFFKYSKAVNEYTQGELSTAVSMLLLFLLRFIGIAIIQDKFNEMLDGTGPGAGVAQPVAPQYGQPLSQPIAPTQPTDVPAGQFQAPAPTQATDLPNNQPQPPTYTPPTNPIQ